VPPAATRIEVFSVAVIVAGADGVPRLRLPVFASSTPDERFVEPVSTVAALPAKVSSVKPFRAVPFIRSMAAPVETAPLSVASIVAFAVRLVPFSTTSPPAVVIVPASEVICALAADSPPVKRLTSVPELPRVTLPVFVNVVVPETLFTDPVSDKSNVPLPVASPPSVRLPPSVTAPV